MAPSKRYPDWCMWPIAWLSNVTSLIPMHPPDVVKVRCQLAAQSGKTATSQGALMLDVVKGIWTQSGVRGFYDGLSAAIMRSTVYGTIKLAGYELLRDAIQRRQGREATALERTGAALCSGAAGSFLACPIEVALVRMQADRRLPVERRRGYRHVFDALFRVAGEEGVLTYWRGSVPTISRGVVVAITQVATYDQCKSVLINSGVMRDGFPLFVASSLISGLCYSYFSMPVDTVKTLMQNQKPLEDGTLKYRGMLRSMVLVAREEGVFRLWRGFGAYWARCGTGTIGLFIAQEQYRNLFAWGFGPRVAGP
eukprot:TRINITY_DN9698_c0_g1_i1.p1 TRINITY_DN9698_c0_g1~~TRINITY_DN9698_c0_g1_i1.p1  ORF type:complete len:321 (+),score=82.57 TRINITY_DN9698_c0_g1_i1:35-964(+)